MTRPYVTVILLVGIGLSAALVAGSVSRQRWPDNQQGYAPEQPIAFSHRLHADELQIHCQYCHDAAAESRHAGIPSGDACMRCHGNEAELRKSLQDSSASFQTLLTWLLPSARSGIAYRLNPGYS